MKDRMDKLLENFFDGERIVIRGIKDMEIPDMRETMDKVMRNTQKADFMAADSHVKEKRRSRFIPKLAYIFSVIFLSIILSSVYDLPKAKAIKFNMARTFVIVRESITTIFHRDNNTPVVLPENKYRDEIVRKLKQNNEKELPFHLFVPTYMPPGYDLDDVQWTEYPGDSHRVEQIYRDGSEGIIYIIQHYNMPASATEMDIISKSTDVKTIKINGLEICLVIKNKGINFADWYDGESRYLIMGPVSEDELISIIKGLK